MHACPSKKRAARPQLRHMPWPQEGQGIETSAVGMADRTSPRKMKTGLAKMEGWQIRCSLIPREATAKGTKSLVTQGED